MEQKVNVWKANLTNGLILGLVAIVYSMLMYFIDLTFNQTQGYIFIAIQVVVIFLLLKSYRDNFLHGTITYGQSVGAGVVIIFYSAVIMALFTFILYSVIDPGLTAKKLAFLEDMMLKKGTPQAGVDAFMKLQEKIQKPAIAAPLSIFVSLIGGTIMSLLISIFIKKEGNPLVDIPEK